MLLNPTFLKYNKASLLAIILSLGLYASFAYNLVRTETTKLLLLYSVLFVLAYLLKRSTDFNFRFLVVIAIIIRLIFLFAIPNLSQDFYRFIWDGRLILEGINPYLHTPNSFIENNEFPITQAQELYNGMGELSAAHYTNYPPLNQLLFFIAALFSGKSILGSVVVMRIIIIAADIGTFYFGAKLLEKLSLPKAQIFWYILNPYIIIELTGNLHFEGVMVFFLVLSLYLIQSGKWKIAAVVFSCSISVKLIPLMFLPLFFNYFKASKKETSQVLKKSKVTIKKLIGFYAIVGVTTLLLFLPFFNSEFINNYSKTVGLWFGNFEFNASVYYIIRALGYAITGYNEIEIIGKLLPAIVLVFVIYLAFFKKNNTTKHLITNMMFGFTVYLILSTTVHPWYLTTLLVLSVFTNYRFPLVWTFVIVLSYLAYSNTNNAENLWIVSLEYFVVFTAFIWEVVLNRKINV